MDNSTKKSPNVAGLFYPADMNELAELIKKLASGKEIVYKSNAVIVPHAGYQFSGHAMNYGFEHLKFRENIFIIAPSHHYDFQGFALPAYDKFETPFGSIDVNKSFVQEIQDSFGCYVNNTPFDEEHSIEVQLPFIQYFTNNTKIINATSLLKGLHKIKIIPVLIGKCSVEDITALIEKFWTRACFVISSDLSHYHPDNVAKQTDNYTAWMIETGHIEEFATEQACGSVGIRAITAFAHKHGFDMIRLEMYNSGDISGDKTKVVGYGSWMLFEGCKTKFISQFYSDYLLDECKKSIIMGFDGQKYTSEYPPAVLQQYGASFVTLEITGHLRGCIGSIYSDKPLINDITANAQSAAFFDPRFEPLRPEEYNDTNISISILSEPEQIIFKDEQDLISKIYPYGIILMDKGKRGVYLPVVWEQLPDKKLFWTSLKEKAGFYKDYFSKSMEVYKFTTEYITTLSGYEEDE